MKQYVDLALRKAKKPMEKEMLYLKVEELMNSDKENYAELSLDDKKRIDEIVDDGLKKYEYIENNTGKISAIIKTSYRTGRFYGNRNKEGFVISRNYFTNKEGQLFSTEDKYSIDKNNCHGAIDGDLVLIDIGGNGVKPKVLDIIDRNLENIVGEVVRQGHSYFVKPIDKKKQVLNIALKGEAIEGQKVAVKLVEQTSDDFYIGEITRVFNHKDDPDQDILWEAFKCGIDDQFSSKSLEQVKRMPNHVLDTDKIGREDLTGWKIFTIDGADTKDIDDALSYRKLPNGNYEVGVHIADVSHYVPENSPLDRDAYKKSTSNYLANKVIPMLPHELSNGICSLNPYVERLAMSCIMELNKDGEVVNYRITPTVIKSNMKMTYDAVNGILKEGKVPEDYKEFEEELIALNKIALTLRKNRILNGSVEFNRPELKLIFDEKGKAIDFSRREQDLGENLIEELMILANETVDKHLSKNGYPCLHRIHGQPNESKLYDYLCLLQAIDLPFAYDAGKCANSRKVMQELVEHIEDTGRLNNMLSGRLIHCFSRAKYSPVNIGHNGLAKQNYCHFTSPIRRYSDLTVHRILKDCAFNDHTKAKRKARKWDTKLPDIGMQTSRMEKIADDAEQQTLYMKCAEYMKKHIGEEYKGTVIGMSDHGLQIQLDNLVEGKVRMRNLSGNYAYNPNTYTLISLDGKEDYYIGDRLLLKVKAASKEDKTIDFSIQKKLEENLIEDINESNQVVKKIAKRKLEDNHYRKKR